MPEKHTVSPSHFQLGTHTVELRTYPVGFGLRFAKAMKHFQKEKVEVKYDPALVVFGIWLLGMEGVYWYCGKGLV